MFCPRCHTEYMEDVTVCSDCGTDLVPCLIEDTEPEPLEWVDFEEVLTTFNAGDIALLKSILDGEGIDYYFQGEAFNYVEPIVQPARLMVPKNQVLRAKEALRELDLEYTVAKGGNKKEEAD